MQKEDNFDQDMVGPCKETSRAGMIIAVEIMAHTFSLTGTLGMKTLIMQWGNDTTRGCL